MYLAQESFSTAAIGIGMGLMAPLLPYHRTYGSRMCVIGHKEMYHKWSSKVYQSWGQNRDRHYFLRSFLGLPLCETRITRPSFLLNSPMNPSLPSGRPVIVCLRIVSTSGALSSESMCSLHDSVETPTDSLISMTLTISSVPPM